MLLFSSTWVAGQELDAQFDSSLGYAPFDVEGSANCMDWTDFYISFNKLNPGL